MSENDSPSHSSLVQIQLCPQLSPLMSSWTVMSKHLDFPILMTDDQVAVHRASRSSCCVPWPQTRHCGLIISVRNHDQQFFTEMNMSVFNKLQTKDDLEQLYFLFLKIVLGDTKKRGFGQQQYDIEVLTWKYYGLGGFKQFFGTVQVNQSDIHW